MGEALPIVIFAVAAVVVAVGGYYAYQAEQKRTQGLAGLAAELGWTFDPEKDPTHDDLYAQFEVFRRGHSRVAHNTLRGVLSVDGRAFPTRMGDFTYKVTSGSGKNRSTQTYRLSYLILDLPFAHVPALLIRPENLMDKLAGAVGFDDIDFESAEFSRRFHVKSADKRFAYDVVHPRMMEFLMRMARPPVIDIERGACCITGARSRWTAAEFRWHMGFAAQFLDLWPDHLTAGLDAGSGRGSEDR